MAKLFKSQKKNERAFTSFWTDPNLGTIAAAVQLLSVIMAHHKCFLVLLLGIAFNFLSTKSIVRRSRICCKDFARLGVVFLGLA